MRVAYLVRSWPRLSQTFVLNEVLALERRGIDLALFAMARSGEPLSQPEAAQVRAPVRYLEDGNRLSAHLRVLRSHPLRYVSALGHALRQRQLYGGYTRSGPWAAFSSAVLMWDGMQRLEAAAPGFTHVHAHFAHDPALIALLVHRLSRLDFTFTAHARDLYQIPEAALRARARQARRVVTCCAANLEYIRRVAGPEAAAELVYHGVDLGRFAPRQAPQPNGEPLVLSVGRLVEKKGFANLLAGCAVLAAEGRRFRCEVYGDGPLRHALEAERDRLGLSDRVQFCGPRTQQELVAVYRRADVFALTPLVTDDGDRDGVPNVLLEAMASGVPVVSTTAGGIGEVVEDGANGLLVDATEGSVVGGALATLLGSPELRQRLGAEAARTAARFDSAASAARLAAIFAGGAQP